MRLWWPKVAFAIATVRNRPRDRRKAVLTSECNWRGAWICDITVIYLGVCREGVCVSDLCRRRYIGVCRGGVCVSDLWRRRYIGVCRGGVCVSDWWRRRFIGVCSGGVMCE